MLHFTPYALVFSSPLPPNKSERGLLKKSSNNVPAIDDLVGPSGPSISSGGAAAITGPLDIILMCFTVFSLHTIYVSPADSLISTVIHIGFQADYIKLILTMSMSSQTLNLNRSTSPSLTTYSLPSSLTLPAFLASDMVPAS